MAGVAGLEPAHDGIKTRCLTTWRHPSNFPEAGLRTVFISPDKLIPAHYPHSTGSMPDAMAIHYIPGR